MPTLIGYVNKDQTFELANNPGPEYNNMVVYSSGMQDPVLKKLDLLRYINKIIRLKVHTYDEKTIYGADEKDIKVL